MHYKPVLLVKTGATIPETRDEFGDFEHWFSHGLFHPDVVQVNVFEGDELPDPREFSGIIVTGSAAMVSHRESWSEKTAEWLAPAVHAGQPILGVCYGHQLLAHALGGVVGPNPQGRQIGTREIQLTVAAMTDALMCPLPPSIHVQTTHVESVHQLPPGAITLATSPQDPNHAFRYGKRAWGVQFHPEFGAAIMRGYIKARAEVLRLEGLDPELLIAGVRETPLANGILHRFAALIGATVGITNRSGAVTRLQEKNDAVDTPFTDSGAGPRTGVHAR